MNYLNELAIKYIAFSICLIICGKHQNEKVKAAFEKVKAYFACGKHQNEKVKAAFEKVKAYFACGKHRNEKVKAAFE
ncbi:MAG: hypothetical protein V7K41_30725 [Nostoc sp.]|uniref:hypothetical protein n=1 Tax=Nostoc sp. TaxID=1180 RepID=UPI002FF46C1A